MACVPCVACSRAAPRTARALAIQRRPVSSLAPVRRVTVHVASPISETERWSAEQAKVASSAPGDRFFTAADSRPVILFDGVCNMCNGGVNLVLDFDKNGVHRFAALQSDAGKELLQRAGRRPDDITSIVVVAKDNSWIKSRAVMKIAENLDFPLRLVSTLSHACPVVIRDVIYDWVADNRYKLMGERDACRLMQPEWRDRFLV